MRITPRLFLGLTAAALICTAAALAVYSAGNRWAPASREGVLAFPSLKSRINDVQVIELTKGGDKLVLKRKGAEWIADDPYAYPVRIEEVRRFLIGFVEARLEEPKTRKREKYALLGLDDPEKKDAEARRVRLLDGSGGVIAEAIIGTKKWNAFGSGNNGHYLRKPDDPQSWLASLDVKSSPKIRDWVDREIFSTTLEDIRSLTIEHPGEEPVRIVKKEGEKDAFELAGLPQDAKRKKDAPGVVSTAESYTGIELDDLRKRDPQSRGEWASIARLETQEGLTLTVHHRMEGEDHWISLQASGSGAAREKAEKINARVEKWEFRIPDWKADSMFRHLSEFIETS
ncbi:MAG: DUF4340 domain-containing protein [Methyloligellaceae bacterium]